MRQPEFITAFNGLLTSEPLVGWRDYLRWHLISETAALSQQAFCRRAFRLLRQAAFRRDGAASAVEAGDGGGGRGHRRRPGPALREKAFSPAAKARALAMVKFIKEAMRQRIAGAAWMSQSTKDEAYKKLDTMRSKIGYPDKWRDYSKLEISRRPYVLNALAADAFEFRREMAKLGKPVDRGEWEMTPQTNNAYYEPTLNEMCFPAGILQPPFFDEKADDASNYGAIGATMGHELTHGFDDQGRQYDAQGNLKNWWTERGRQGFRRAGGAAWRSSTTPSKSCRACTSTAIRRSARTSPTSAGCAWPTSAFKLATEGKQLRPIDGFTPDQRFFIAFAQSWRTNERPEQVRLHVQSDVHSPVRWRVLGSVANYPEFLQAFGCKPEGKTWPAIW